MGHPGVHELLQPLVRRVLQPISPIKPPVNRDNCQSRKLAQVDRVFGNACHWIETLEDDMVVSYRARIRGIEYTDTIWDTNVDMSKAFWWEGHQESSISVSAQHTNL